MQKSKEQILLFQEFITQAKITLFSPPTYDLVPLLTHRQYNLSV